MPDHNANVLHVVGADVPPSRLEALRTLCARPEMGRQRVIQFGRGPVDHLGLGKVQRISVPLGLGRLGRPALKALISTTGQTVVHIWSTSALGWALHAARWGARPGSASGRSTFRLLMELESPLDSRWPAGLLLQGARERRVHFVCPSGATQRCLWALGVSPDQCALIRDSVDDAALEAAHRATLRERLDIRPEHVGVLILPPVRRETGALVAAWGAMLLEHARAGVRLIVPDVGRETAHVVRLVESCGLGETLRAVGRRFTLPELLTAADLAAYLPTGDAPLFGVAWAMTAGRTIVAADVPVIRELLTHGRTAWLCRPDDPKEACRQMLNALERREQSSRQVEAARAHANAAFGRRRLIAQYWCVYGNLLADRLVSSGLDDVALVS